MWYELSEEYRLKIDDRIQKYSITSTNHDCILWTSACASSNCVVSMTPCLGISIQGRFKFINVRKYLLERKLGRILRFGYISCHTCDNVHGPCVNPDHLYEGNHTSNALDMVERGRCPSRVGITNPNAFLTVDDVLDIYFRSNKGEKGIKLSKEFGVNPQTISKIKHKNAWKYILKNV